jgi:hypothetical protein
MNNDFKDAYRGARGELAIWKKRALEAEAKVREQDLIIERLGDALNEENGPTYMGEPRIQQRTDVRPAVSADGAYRFNPLTGQHE